MKKEKEKKKKIRLDSKETLNITSNENNLEEATTHEEFSDINSHHHFKLLKKLLIIIIFLVIFIRFYGVSQIVTKEYSIIDNNIPTGFDGMKIVQISDIHYGTTINETSLKKLVNKVNELKPDIIVFTGDLVDKSINTTDKIKAEITVNLSKIEANIGKFAILSDEDSKNSYSSDLITNSGFTLLNNESKLIYNNDIDPIELVGITSLPSTIKTSANYKIALIHKPDDADNIINDNYNIIMSGHSHGGIIKLPYIGGLINIKGAKKYHNDYYNLGNTKLYISSGLGTSNINFRMFNQPSINLYRFYKE